MREDRFKQHDLGMDKYAQPVNVDYQMTVRDYVLRPKASSTPITITLPPVAEARGRFYSIIADTCDMTNTVTITDKGHGVAGAGSDSEQWEGDMVLFEDGQGGLLYSDGMKWMLRTFADVEMGASTRGQYNKAAAEIHGMTARGGRFRAEARSQAALTLVNADGVHAQGVAYASLFAETVNALYAEAMAKDQSTVATIRGAMITCNSEGTPTAIGTMYGAHIRCYTNVQPTVYRGLVIEHEQYGGLHALMHEFIKIIDSVFDAVDTCASYGLRILTTGIITTGISLESPMVTGMQLTNSYSSAGLAIGRLGTELIMQAAAPLIEVHGTSALASGTFDCVEIRLTQTSAIQTGYVKALRVHASSTVKTPGSFNAGYFKLDYTTNGYPWGDCAPVSAELLLPNADMTRGLYAVHECQIGGQASTALGAAGPLCFMHFNIYGTKTVIDANCFLFVLDAVSSGVANLWYDHQGGAPANVEEWIKVRTPGGTRWLALYDAVV